MEVEDKAVELIDKLANAIEAAAKPATDLALQAIQLQATIHLVGGGLLILLACVLAYGGYRATRDSYTDESIPLFAFAAFAALGGAIMIFTNVLAAINPAAALALRVIDAVS